MIIRSIQAGKIRTVLYRDRTIMTGIFKGPVHGPVWLRALNIEGDEQADLSVHGGKDKALYTYALDAYEAWKELRPAHNFPPGAMGENFSVDHMPEDKICIGDTFEVGEAVIQATQPRFPCYKLAAKFNDPHIIRQFMELKRPGIYFRVLKEGRVEQGQVMKLVDQEKVRVSVLELFLLGNSAPELSRLQEILKLKTLNDQWRQNIQSKFEE